MKILGGGGGFSCCISPVSSTRTDTNIQSTSFLKLLLFFFIYDFLIVLIFVSPPLAAFCEWISFSFHKCSLRVCFSRTREKRRDDGKWRDYDRYYDRSDLYRDKSSWRRGRSKSRSKSRGLSRSRSRSRGRSKDHDANRSVGEYSRCCFRRTVMSRTPAPGMV